MKYSFAKTPLAEPLLCITFDDGYKTDRTIAYPEMSARGIKGTTYVVGYYTDNFPEYMTTSQLLEMVGFGWDIQCHTYDHAYLGKLRISEVIHQLRRNNEVFSAKGIAEPKHIAYPYGNYIYDTRKTLMKYRISQRATGGTVPSVQSLDDIDINRIGAWIADMKNQTEYDTVKGYLDTAIAQNKVLVLYWHDMTAEKQPYFIQFLDYVVQKGIKTVTHSELYEILKWKDFNYKFI